MIGLALLVPVLLAPTVLAPTAVSHAQSKTMDATPPSERPAARGSRIARSSTAQDHRAGQRGAKVKAAETPAACTHIVRRGESVGASPRATASRARR